MSEGSSTYRSPSKDTAAPLAVQLLTDDYFWDICDENSPFGNDDGADFFASYAKAAKSVNEPDGIVFLANTFEGWGLDASILDELAAPESSVAGSAEPSPQSDFSVPTGFPGVLPGAVDLEAIAAMLQGSGMGMNPAVMKTLAAELNTGNLQAKMRDNAVIALAFAQLVLFGNVDPAVADCAIAAIKFQQADAQTSRWASPEERAGRLKQWQAIMESFLDK